MKLKSSFFIFVFIIQACSYYPVDFNRDQSSLVSETSKYIKIGDAENKALIFYPGGLVDPFAYVNMLSKILNDNVTVFIPKVPYNLGILNINHAQEIKKAFPEMLEWSIGGHSLGGTVACFVLDEHPEEYKNLILMASYPAESIDLMSFKGTVISLYGSLDGVADIDKLLASQSQFNNAKEVDEIDQIEPNDMVSYFYKIEGGNHSNFGNYGFQKGDAAATITNTEQQLISTSIISKILEQ